MAPPTPAQPPFARYTSEQGHGGLSSATTGKEERVKRFIIMAALALFVGACAGNDPREEPQTPQSPADNPQLQNPASPEPTGINSAKARQAQQAISEAQAAADKADSVGYLWRDTEAIIEEARKAAEANDYDQAIELADEARRQSEQAWRQYLEQRDAATRN